MVWGEFHHPVEDEEGGDGQTHLRVLNGAGGEAAPLSSQERTRARPPSTEPRWVVTSPLSQRPHLFHQLPVHVLEHLFASSQPVWWQ